ncbi:MAG: 6-carboxytetrahydropterin synthase QueD [Candidatus Delongbacteria bacterium]|nr:6-carboxytetrahydropterin synthase QueD [Candidatus Delongbacteria bacterium]
MYEIFVKHHFSSAHKLVDYEGECKKLHGHNWKVQVHARAKVLNEIGISFDFKEFKKIVREEIDKFDHVYLNEHPVLKNINPTAENMARILFDILSEQINNNDLKIYMVEIWETENNGVRYFKDK